MKKRGRPAKSSTAEPSTSQALTAKASIAKPSTSSPKRTNPSRQSAEEARRKRPVEESPSPQIEYTPEEEEAVLRVDKCKDFYEILEVTKDATTDDIKQAFKKLALILHPDKNSAPGSTQAFQKVLHALAVLTDSKKRIEYDRRGEKPAHSREPEYQDYTRGFKFNFTQEELMKLLLVVAGVLIIGGLSYMAYKYVTNKNEKEPPQKKKKTKK